MASSVTYTEQELISLLQQKSKEGFDYLYANYSAALYGVISRIVTDEQTAQDVLQDVFVKIWKSIGKYDATKGRLYTWMLNLARNTSIDKLRSKGEIMKGKIQNDEAAVYDSSNLKTEQETNTIGLRDTVAGLEPQYQVIVELAYFKGFTLDEISKTIDVPLGTVKTRMRKAITMLRTHFKN